jgi:hypothetical protein
MILRVLRVFLHAVCRTGNRYSLIPPGRECIIPVPSFLSLPVDVGDRRERRIDKLDLAVPVQIETRDVDRLPDLIEGDVLGEQGRDLRVEAGDFDAHRDRRRALGEFPV